MRKLILFIIILTAQCDIYAQGLQKIGDTINLLAGETDDFISSDYEIVDNNLYYIIKTKPEEFNDAPTEYRCVNLSDVKKTKIKRQKNDIMLYVYSGFYKSGYSYMSRYKDCLKENKNYSGGPVFTSNNASLIIKLQEVIESIPNTEKILASYINNKVTDMPMLIRSLSNKEKSTMCKIFIQNKYNGKYPGSRNYCVIFLGLLVGSYDQEEHIKLIQKAVSPLWEDYKFTIGDYLDLMYTSNAMKNK